MYCRELLSGRCPPGVIIWWVSFRSYHLMGVLQELSSGGCPSGVIIWWLSSGSCHLVGVLWEMLSDGCPLGFVIRWLSSGSCPLVISLFKLSSCGCPLGVVICWLSLGGVVIWRVSSGSCHLERASFGDCQYFFFLFLFIHSSRSWTGYRWTPLQMLEIYQGKHDFHNVPLL